MTPRVPSGLDRELVQIYLTDHRAAATGVLHRLERMSTSYADLPIHDDLLRLTAEIRGEHRTLTGIIDGLDLGRRPALALLARVGELAGRLKLNGRLFSRSPLSPLLELELLQSGVSGKVALWRTLGSLSTDLGLDTDELAALGQQAADQLEVISRCHATLVRTAFADRSEP